MKVAKFCNDLKELLDKKEAEMHWEPTDGFRIRNRLLPAFLPVERIPDIKTINVRCISDYTPDSKAVRLDNGYLPIYVEITDDTVSIISTADYIEWCEEAGNFFYSLEYVEHISLHDIDFKDAQKIDSLFNGDKSLKDVDFKNLINTEDIYSMTYMFAGCQSIEEIDMSAFKSEWQHVARAFTGCISLKTVKGMHITHACFSLFAMFRNCESLQEIEGISNWDVSHVREMNNMFTYCKGLKALDLSGWNTERLEEAKKMFYECFDLKEIKGIKDWNVISLKFTGGMFGHCVSLEAIDLSGWNTKSLKNTDSMFYGCEQVKSINLNGWKTSRVTSMAGMFENCKSMEEIDISTFSTGAVSSMTGMFKGCESLKALDLSGFKLKKCMYINEMFADCRSLNILDLTGWELNRCCQKGYVLDNCDSLVFVDTSVFDY